MSVSERTAVSITSQRRPLAHQLSFLIACGPEADVNRSILLFEFRQLRRESFVCGAQRRAWLKFTRLYVWHSE
jgi:hypothetical protein